MMGLQLQIECLPIARWRRPAGTRLAEAAPLYRVMVELDVGYCSAVSLAVGRAKINTDICLPAASSFPLKDVIVLTEQSKFSSSPVPMNKQL